MDFIGSFLNDRIELNGKEYTRNDFEKIAEDLGLPINNDPSNIILKNVAMGNATINGVKCSKLMLEAVNGRVMDIISYPNSIAPLIESCSAKCEPETYNTFAGRLCDYVFDETHKVTVPPTNNMILCIWD